MPAPTLTPMPNSLSPMYDKWLIFDFFPTVLFLTSTKFPIFDPSSRIVPGLNLARLRPGTILEEGSKIGNFVEVKKSTVGKKSKINHLSYIGDSELGIGVNVGAGTITCNYDGVKKSKTKIKDNVFIGSNSSLVAPITLEKNSIVGAGSVITKKVKKNSLALTRSSQTEVNNYKRRIK